MMRAPAAFAAVAALAVLIGTATPALRAEIVPPPGGADARVRVVDYDPDQVYRIRGRVGYQLELEFEVGERFLGLATGDIDGVEFSAEQEHVFIKPKAAPIATNLTVVTDRRVYRFEYIVGPEAAHTSAASIYALRFRYPKTVFGASVAPAAVPRVRNDRYAFCGAPSLRPVRAYDDGERTTLEFAARQELPAVFTRNEDGSESLVNFSVEPAGLVIHRVAEHLVLRRGRLVACVWNRGREMPATSASGAARRVPDSQ